MYTYLIAGLALCIGIYLLASLLKSAAKVIAAVLCLMLVISFWGVVINKEEAITYAVKIKDKILDSQVFGYFKEKANDTADAAVDKVKEKIKEGLE